MEEKKPKGFEEIRDKMDLLELHIKRIPRHTKRWFVDYSNDQFEGDYGMCLKHVVDMYRGMTPVGYDELQSQINQLQVEIDTLKSNMIDDINKEQEQNKPRTMGQKIEQMKKGE